MVEIIFVTHVKMQSFYIIDVRNFLPLSCIYIQLMIFLSAVWNPYFSSFVEEAPVRFYWTFGMLSIMFWGHMLTNSALC